jgi:hypothetical protein
METETVVKTQWAVYRYDSICYPGGSAMPLAEYRPKEGELLVIKNTPWFSGFPVLIHGFNNRTVAELVEGATAQAVTGDILSAEIQARTQGDLELLAQVHGILPWALRSRWFLITGPSLTPGWTAARFPD